MASVSGAEHERSVGAATAAEVRSLAEGHWLRQAQGGDRAAYGQVVLAYQDRVYNAVLKVVGDRDEARELTQETFLRGLANLASFRGDSSPYTWLFRIAVNLAIGHVRKRGRRRVRSLDAVSAEGDERNTQAAGLVDRMARSGDEVVEAKERDRAVMAALGRVEAEYRALLVMRDVDGMEYGQIAEVMELPLGTVKSRIFRARMALREELKEYFGERGQRSEGRGQEERRQKADGRSQKKTE